MKKTAEAFQQHLVANGFLKAEQVGEVRKRCAETKEKFKPVCLKLKFIDEDTYAAAEAEFLELPFVRLKDVKPDPALLKLIPVKLVKDHGVFPIAKTDKEVTVAVADPYNIFMVDAIREAVKTGVKLALAAETDIWQHIKKHYEGPTIAQTAQSARQGTAAKKAAPAGMEPQAFQMDFRKLMAGGGKEAPVVKLVDQTIMQAIEDRASDIHIEPEQDYLRVRYRIDGVLVEGDKLPKDVQSPIVSRLKIMAKLDIAERRKPQDGKIQMNVNGQDVDIRVSCYPTTYGENVVLRVLDRSNSILDLEQLGFCKPLRKAFGKLLSAPYGIVLVTGPTGAGKTTTLYAALQAINTVDKNIMTIEDPIEYQIPMIRQSQVNIKAGLTFASGLRSLLRQDPDVMLIGEVRDKETAEIAVESALTGHLVFATLHTNDAAGAITRLHDMGVETFLISSSVIGVMAQRLVRQLCKKCRKLVPVEEFHLEPADVKTLENLRKSHKEDLPNLKEGPLKLYQAGKCEECKNLGFRGRLSIYELLTVDDNIRELMSKRASSAAIRSYAFKEGNLTMRQYGFLKVLQGETTVAEVLKVVQTD